ncbi:MAG TPA: MerR family DNA-binding transcriptional regulator [Candidatus Acidoferrum sp.]|nr:MerR family DNA-binding transcriptional regulator [Candidatus Acidoferrum sp.]
MEQKLFRSGQLARMTGVSTDLLRHYERIGVLPAAMRAANGYRLYPSDSAKRVCAVRSSVALGFSLAELSGIFISRDRGGIPCRKVRALAEEKLKGIEQSLKELRTLRRHIREVLRQWDRRLAEAGRGRRAALLESLDEIQVRREALGSTLKTSRKGFRR